jgi:hypothetical protein
LVHAIDGLGMGLVIIPIKGNFVMKLYDESKGEKFGDIVKPMIECVTFLVKS